MPIYTDDPCNDGAMPSSGFPLFSSLGVNPKITKAIDAATKDWLDKHPEATTTVEDDSLTNAKFMDGSVNSRVIEDESITTDDIADLAVTTPKIVDNAVTTPKIADNAVTAQKVASSAADGLRTMSTTQPGVAKVGAGLAMDNNGALELNGGNIAPAVTAWLNAHPEATTTVQDGAITTPKLADGVVTDAKLAQGGVKSDFANSQKRNVDIVYTRFVNGRGVSTSSGAYVSNPARAATHLTRLWRGQTIFCKAGWYFGIWEYDASGDTIVYIGAVETKTPDMFTANSDMDVVIAVRKADDTDITDEEINAFRLYTYAPVDVEDILPSSVHFTRGYGLWKDNGEVYTSNSYQTSEYISVKPGQACWITAVFGGNIVNDNYTGAYGYDKDKRVVGCIANLQLVYGWKNLLDNRGSLCYVYKHKIIIPENVYFIRLSGRVDDVIAGVSPSVILNTSESIKDRIDDAEASLRNTALIDKTSDDRYHWAGIHTEDVNSLGIGANRGQFTKGSTISLRTVTNVEHFYLDVEPGEHYSISVRTDSIDGSNGIGACFTDDFDTVISSADMYASVAGEYELVTKRVSVPTGATRLWVFSKVLSHADVVPNGELFISKLVKFDDAEYSVLKPLYVGEIVQGGCQTDGTIIEDPTHHLYNLRLSQKDVIALPRGSHNKKLKVFCAPTVLVYFRFGKSGSATDYTVSWFENGDEIEIPEGYNYYRVGIGRGHKSYSAGNLQISTDFQHEVRIYYVENDIPRLNGNELHCANAILDTSIQGRYAINSYPVIAHASDVHGDHERLKRFMSYCDRRGVDLACITGDFVSFKSENNMTFVKGLIKQHTTLPALCVGNHDVNKNGITDEEVFAEVFEGIEQTVGNETEKTWYCKDIPEKSLRMISINCYQYGGGIRTYQHYTTEQMEWLCQTLAETPAGYGVLLLAHQPFSVQEPVADHIEFFQSPRDTNLRNEGLSGTPILDIIDAFIGKTTLSKNYTQSGTPASFSVSADFTNLNNDVEFIAHINGHTHQDGICYASGCVERQLYLNVTCTVAAYGGSTYPYLCDIGDQARNPADGSQDAFNVYVIDRVNKAVRVVRIGNTLTKDYATRDYMTIAYA